MNTNKESEKPRLLITEDDLENQRFLQFFLKNHFEIEICDSEESFYKCLNESDFDVILMDISLKGNKNGLQLTRELKSKPGYENIPVICLTAHAFQSDMENALNAGVDAFLTKPIENQVLLNTLLDAIQKKAEERTKH